METLVIEIPQETLTSVRLPKQDLKRELLKELGVALYQRGALSFGKARALAGMTRWAFAEELGRRGIPRHYGERELMEDIAFAEARDQ